MIVIAFLILLTLWYFTFKLGSVWVEFARAWNEQEEIIKDIRDGIQALLEQNHENTKKS